jgi:hypothetical protein
LSYNCGQEIIDEENGMKHLLIGLICAGLILSTNVLGANAAKTKSNVPKKTDRTAADSMPPREVTITGLVTMSNDGKSYVIKNKISTGAMSNTIKFLPRSRYKYEEFELLEVKAVCIVRGSDIISVKSFEALDKEAYEAKKAELRAASKKAAEEKQKK